MSEQGQNSGSNHSQDGQTSSSEGSTSVLQNEELAKANEQAEKFKNDFLYLRAEFENYKRHSIKERSDLVKFGAERFVRDLLSVIDNFERALQTQVTAENYKTVIQGVQMTSQQIKDLLVKHGVAEIPSEGVAFDPNVHEALSSEPSDSVQEGHVLRVFQKAYKLHDKLIRPAQVVVAKKP